MLCGQLCNPLFFGTYRQRITSFVKVRRVICEYAVWPGLYRWGLSDRKPGGEGGRKGRRWRGGWVVEGVGARGPAPNYPVSQLHPVSQLQLIKKFISLGRGGGDGVGCRGDSAVELPPLPPPYPSPSPYPPNPFLFNFLNYCPFSLSLWLGHFGVGWEDFLYIAGIFPLFPTTQTGIRNFESTPSSPYFDILFFWGL